MQLKRFEEILNQIDENRYIFIEDLEKTNIIKKKNLVYNAEEILSIKRKIL